MSSLLLPGDAGFADVLAGKKFSAGSHFNAQGTMPNNGAVTLIPSGNGTVAVPAGYHNGAGVVDQVNVPAANVLTGTTIAGVAGTMPNQGSPSWTPGPNNILLPAGYYTGGTIQGDVNLAAANIISGKSIFGVAGNAPNVDKTIGGSVVYFFGEGITTWTSVTLSGSVTWSNGGYYLSHNNGSTSGPQTLFYPNTPIDVTGWKYVVAFFHDMFENFSFCVSQTNGDTSNVAGAQGATTNIGPTDAGPNYSQLFYADISALSGLYYIKLLGTDNGTSFSGGRCYAIVLMQNVY